jgi:hypothetical protein
MHLDVSGQQNSAERFSFEIISQLRGLGLRLGLMHASVCRHRSSSASSVTASHRSEKDDTHQQAFYLPGLAQSNMVVGEGS